MTIDPIKIEYRFQNLSSKRFESLENNEVKECLMKWSMKDRILIQAFSFDKPFHKYQKKTFFEEFFSSPHVASSLQVCSSNGRWVPMGITSNSVKLEEVACSITSMDFFDRLYGEVVREDGRIIRCHEEYIDEIEGYVDDELKKVLWSEESEHRDLYSDEERSELLLLLLGHLLVGGSLCQADELVQPYLNVTKLLYRDLIGVHMDSKLNKIVVSSVVYRVSLLDSHGKQIYPSIEEHPQNFAYACVDPLKKQVVMLCHRFGVSLPSVE